MVLRVLMMIIASTNLALSIDTPYASTLVVDVGNTRTKVAYFEDNHLVHQSFFPTHDTNAYNQLSQWLETEFTALPTITHIALSSVVPPLNHFWVEACQFIKKPLYVLSPSLVSSQLTFDIDNPQQLGADRIAGLLGAQQRYPGEHVVTVDMGTAITLNFLTRSGCYVGGAILNGMQTSINHLTEMAALLPKISLTPTPLKVGKNTTDQMQLNLHFYKAGIKNLITEMAPLAFGHGQPFKIIGTGGDAPLMKDFGLFDVIEPDLKLHGVLQAFRAHQKSEACLKILPNLTPVDA
jgi:type III pantothenate kinase